mmetsp:Transcript_61280/g.55272  ORF Transcript_61280/g.55272 Transcript_61280/m.55272 type:complete len:520 (+) Transcript_61280:135-1694(+)
MIYLFIGAVLAIGAKSQDLECGGTTCNATRGEFVCVDFTFGGSTTEICGACITANDCNSNAYWTDNWAGATNLECRDIGGGFGIDSCLPPACDDTSECGTDQECYTLELIGGICVDSSLIPTTNITTPSGCSTSEDCYFSSEPVCAYGECVSCMETSDCTNNTIWYGEGYTCQADYSCQQVCTSNDDCKDEYYRTFCNKTSGDCVECLEDANCEDYDDSGEAYICQSSSWSGGYCTYPSSLCDEGDDAYCIKYFGDDYSCQGNAYLEDYYYCSDEVSPFCEPGDDDCATRFGDGYECLEDPFSGYSYCSNETSPFCTKSIDCLDYSIDSDSDDLGPLFSVFDYDCESVTVPVNISGTITEFPVNVCLPQDQCSDNDDCLTGSECQEYDADGVYSWKMCMLADNTCTDGGDECKAIDSSLECYVAEGRCYLPCNPDNKNGDCDVEQGWFCQSPEDDIWGCLPLGIENVTRVETEDPTPAPTAEPTAEPESGEPGYNEGSASHLTIFGGMFIIMIKYILFM